MKIKAKKPKVKYDMLPNMINEVLQLFSIFIGVLIILTDKETIYRHP